MGLHRRQSLLGNFVDPQERTNALCLFWCVYVLDRQWGLGTGLPFALADRDIDPELPEIVSFIYVCGVKEGTDPVTAFQYAIPEMPYQLRPSLLQNMGGTSPIRSPLKHHVADNRLASRP
jgi:hypothetical protein